MKYPKKHAVSQEGVAFVNKIISNSGSIFRPIHNEGDPDKTLKLRFSVFTFSKIVF